VIEYAHDNLYRNTQEVWKTGGSTVRTLSFTYDAAGQLTQASDPAATLAYAYDDLGRTTSETQTIAGLTPQLGFTSTYDANSNRLSLASTIGGTADFKNTYTYDHLDRLTRLVQEDVAGGNVLADKRVDFQYNALGQYTQIDRYQSVGTTAYVGTTVFAYDGMNRLIEMDHKQGSTLLAGYDYTYDAASRITSINSLLDGLTTYAYDSTDQLTAADHAAPRPDEAYSYDLNGNRTMSGYVVQANNRTTSDGTYSYEYDDEGNRTRRTNTADGSYEEYEWDHRNRLSKITFKDSSGNVLKTVQRSYDAFDRWIRRVVDPDGPGPAAAVDTFFAHEGSSINPVLQFAGPAAANLDRRYLWSNHVDEILADEDVNSLTQAGNVLWLHTNHLGTATDLADFDEAAGMTAIANHRVYNGFGSLTSESHATVDLLFGFTGRLSDDTTGLQNNWHRWYDAAIGQWYSEDPIGFGGGDVNLKQYVQNDPVNRTDPTGLRDGHHWVPQSVIDAMLAAGELTSDAATFLRGATLDPSAYDHAKDPWNTISHDDYIDSVRALFAAYRNQFYRGRPVDGAGAKQFLNFIREGCDIGLTMDRTLARHWHRVRLWVAGFDKSIAIAKTLKKLTGWWWSKPTPQEIKAATQLIVNGETRLPVGKRVQELGVTRFARVLARWEETSWGCC
jgi:RHS repeat-associated protein